MKRATMSLAAAAAAVLAGAGSSLASAQDSTSVERGRAKFAHTCAPCHADGVSDLALKRAEYQRVFASGGIAGLVAELEAQTQRLSEG